MEKLIFLFILLLGLSSCTGEKWNDCIQSHGPDKTEVRNHGLFTKIKVDGNFAVTLIQDSTYSVEVTAGDNFLPQILTKVENGQLILEEDITCKFIRDQERVYSLVIHCGKLDRIEHYSGKALRGDNITSDRLEIDKWAGGGDIDLELNCDSLFGRIHAGSGDLLLSGFSNFGYLYQRGYGFIRNKALDINYAYVDKGGTGDCSLTVLQKTEIDFDSPGDLYLYGGGDVTVIQKDGDGSIIESP